MVSITTASRIPNSPFLNQSFYIIFGFGTLSTVTGAFCSLGSVIAPIRQTGSSYAAVYSAGSVPVGTYAIYAYAVSGSTGSFANDKSITIQASDIADPAKTLYDILRNNIGATYASTAFSTGWYSNTVRYPQVTVTRANRSDMSGNLDDTFRTHEETLYVDTWIAAKQSPASPYFGASGWKNALTLLDSEVKRIINSQRKAPSTKLRHMQITQSQALDEITDNRKVFRTRHTIRLKWDETLS